MSFSYFVKIEKIEKRIKIYQQFSNQSKNKIKLINKSRRFVTGFFLVEKKKKVEEEDGDICVWGFENFRKFQKEVFSRRISKEEPTTTDTIQQSFLIAHDKLFPYKKTGRCSSSPPFSISGPGI
eukprot:TRINITY_DN3673_c0_g2_i1.p1 TRINITY_DN3673_c0_g2~~TRINITY_DN3673_c0_g2_i1.p1  ORF type:complete len:133 (+),score=25.77 TRINITY_DN3673_c0_g2_i1:28-399(+)